MKCFMSIWMIAVLIAGVCGPGIRCAASAESASSGQQEKEQGKQVYRFPGSPPMDIAIGQKAMNFQVKDMDGKDLSLSQYNGKWVLLDFWATWCGPCIREMDTVIALYKKYNPQGLEIIGISLDRSPVRMKEYVRAKSIPWRQHFDGNGWRNEVAVKYNVHSIPYTYLINPDGIIVGKRLRGPYLEKALKIVFDNENVDKGN